MELVLTDGTVLNELARENKTLWQKIKDRIFEIIEKIKKAYGDLSKTSRTAQVLKETVESLEEIERLFTEGVREAGERTRTAGVETQTEGERVYSFTPADFEKPITLHDIEVLRGIGRRSINKFSSEDIEKAQKWAYKFYKEMGTKSPFFRAWFGDWRAYDTKTKLPIVPVNAETIDRGDVPRGDFKNEDTGWSITSNSDGIDETSNKEQKRSDSYHALKDINDLLKNAVLLDTVVVTAPSKRMGKNAALMHHMYCPISVNGEIGVAKLYIAESLGDKHKFYLMRIEKASTAMGFNTENGESTPHSIAATDDAMVSIAQIFEFVKEHHDDFEKNSDHYVPFEPKPVNELMLDENKEPRVFYHGTNAEFTVFDARKSRVGAFGKGFYLSPSKANAGMYGSSRIIESYVSLQNPYIVRDSLGLNYETLQKMQADLGEGQRITDKNAMAVLKKHNYDGIVVVNNGRIQEIVLYDPKKIKSATDNIGTFDGTYPDIRYSIDETPETPDVSENATDTNDGRTEEELTDRDMLLAMAERLGKDEQGSRHKCKNVSKKNNEASIARKVKNYFPFSENNIQKPIDKSASMVYNDANEMNGGFQNRKAH